MPKLNVGTQRFEQCTVHSFEVRIWKTCAEICLPRNISRNNIFAALLQKHALYWYILRGHYFKFGFHVCSPL